MNYQEVLSIPTTDYTVKAAGTGDSRNAEVAEVGHGEPPHLTSQEIGQALERAWRAAAKQH